MSGVYVKAKSLIDETPLILVIIKNSSNKKTGDMAQSYILREDISPSVAVKSGADSAICGNCPHRGILAKGTSTASCYVNVGYGPSVVYRSFLRGNYPLVTVAEAANFVRYSSLRMGSYGDPGAIPSSIWKRLGKATQSHTGYTHRWKDTGKGLRGLCMASVDSIAEQKEAEALGWATFRISYKHRDRVYGEAICPASKEAGHKVTCLHCPVKCNGEVTHKLKGRVILDHGPGGISRKL